MPYSKNNHIIDYLDWENILILEDLNKNVVMFRLKQKQMLKYDF